MASHVISQDVLEKAKSDRLPGAAGQQRSERSGARRAARGCCRRRLPVPPLPQVRCRRAGQERRPAAAAQRSPGPAGAPPLLPGTAAPEPSPGAGSAARRKAKSHGHRGIYFLPHAAGNTGRFVFSRWGGGQQAPSAGQQDRR